MRKLIFLLALIPFMLSGQTPEPLVDLSKYHDDNRKDEMIDNNFTDITTGNYLIPELQVAVLDYEPPHGSFAFSDSAFALPLSVNVWAKVTNVANDLFTSVDADGITFAGDTITIITPGDYMIWWGLSFSGGPSDVYHAAIYKNAVITPFEMHRNTSNNDIGNANLNALLDDLVAGDDISVYMRNTGDNDDPTLISSQLMIYMIHPR